MEHFRVYISNVVIRLSSLSGIGGNTGILLDRKGDALSITGRHDMSLQVGAVNCYIRIPEARLRLTSTESSTAP